MRVADLERVLDELAPFSLAEPWDNSGLQVGDREAAVRKVLVAFDLTPAVLDEAIAEDCTTVVTHHPLLFTPVRSLIASRPLERLLRRIVSAKIDVISCHTNLDSAAGGISDTAAQALGLKGLQPLVPAPAGWRKFVGFIPVEAVERVASAVFAARAGVIGEYAECAYALNGQGWFTPGAGAQPHVGHQGLPERTPEVRWETVVPHTRVNAVVRAYVQAHPYEEPAFDIYPVEDLLPRAGLGRVGRLVRPSTVTEFAGLIAEAIDVVSLEYSGDGTQTVERVAVVPGSGASLLPEARGLADVFVTGDVSYHVADKADDAGLALIVAPHGELEWLGLRRWAPRLQERLAAHNVALLISRTWRSPWKRTRPPGDPVRAATSDDHLTVSVKEAAIVSESDGASVLRAAVLRVDGGSRGNPGPGAIGVVLEDDRGKVVEEIGRTIGVTTNNIAEYRALLTGLERAEALGVEELTVFSDSELLVKQVNGQYRVKNEGLKPLYDEVLLRLRRFPQVHIEHVRREKNAAADRLVNQALDEN